MKSWINLIDPGGNFAFVTKLNAHIFSSVEHVNDKLRNTKKEKID